VKVGELTHHILIDPKNSWVMENLQPEEMYFHNDYLHS
jgi:hypothetical protein